VNAVPQRIAGTFRRSLSNRPGAYRAARRAKVLGRYALRRPHEPDFRAVPELGLDGRVFLDVGANSGQSALSFRLYDRRSPIVSVEANPDLEADLRLVGRILRRFSYVMCAACAEDGPVELRIPTYRGVDISGEASVLPDDGEAGWWSQQHLQGEQADDLALRTVTVPGMRLDRLELAPGLVKIDVEGAAPMVVDGLWETISRHHPAILIEADSEMDALVGRLAELGYRPFSWDDGAKRFVPLLPDGQNIFFLMR
jgi:FkbM family methyltransferase